MNGIQKIISGCLALCLVLSMLPMQVLAADENVAESAMELPVETMLVFTEETDVTETTEPIWEQLDFEVTDSAENALIRSQYETDMELIRSGNCGNNLYYEFYEDGVLVISGSGEMDEYEKRSISSNAANTYIPSAPWGIFSQSRDTLNFSYNGIIDEYSYPDLVDKDWEALNTVIIEEGVTSVGAYAFYYCLFLDTVKLPSTLKEVGQCAFYSTVANELILSDQVTRVGDFSLEVDSGLTKGTTTIAIGAKAASWYTEPLSVKNLFYYGTEEQWKEYVEDQGWMRITPSSVYHESVYNPNAVYQYDASSKTLTYSGNGCIQSFDLFLDAMRSKKTAIEHIVIKEGITGIGAHAFRGCTALKTVSIPSTVTDIGQYAFYNCTALKTVNFDGSYDQWAANVSVAANNNPLQNASYNYSSAHTHSYTEKVTPSTCTTPGYTLYSCACGDTYRGNETPVRDHNYVNGTCSVCGDQLKTLSGTCGTNVTWTLVNGVLTISGNGNMSSGMLFRDEAVAAQVQKVVINHGITRIGWDAFSGCINLTSVSIPNSVTEIQSLVFLDCNKLTSITIPASVTDIWENAFNGCQSLRRIDVDSKNTAYSSNQGVLFNKTQTKLIRVPEGYTGSWTVPYGVTEVGSTAFLACKGLTEITFTGKAPKIESNSFYATSTTVYYPKDDASWNSVITSNYGGTITWKAKNVPVHQHTYSNNVDGTCNSCGIHRETVETRQVTHMFRMYNPNTGEHFYTGSEVEKGNLVTAGWQYEGVGFTFPANTGAPVHRLFQPSTGEHLYTMDEDEKAMLMADGWNYEGIAFNSAYDTEAVQHRLHNPNATVGAYHFTFSEEEMQNLIAAGWEYQGIGWYSCWK